MQNISEKSRNTGKFTIKNEHTLTRNQFAKIARRIKREHGVDMFWVNRNNQKFSDLYKRWERKPLQGFWVDQTLDSKNYPGITLNGPALYLFQGRTINKFNSEVIYDITSYTVQHELFHMKMWLRIKERFPKDFIKKFHELSDEIHEAFVLSEFVKAKQFTKWDEADIINDLDAFNKNFKMNKTLEDFKNFDLDEYLNNL